MVSAAPDAGALVSVTSPRSSEGIMSTDAPDRWAGVAGCSHCTRPEELSEMENP